MTQTPVMSIRYARDLLKKLIDARDGDELKQLVAENIMWCDGVFFAELEGMVDEFKRRGDDSSAQKLKELGDFMARLRFMI